MKARQLGAVVSGVQGQWSHCVCCQEARRDECSNKWARQGHFPTITTYIPHPYKWWGMNCYAVSEMDLSAQLPVRLPCSCLHSPRACSVCYLVQWSQTPHSGPFCLHYLPSLVPPTRICHTVTTCPCNCSSAHFSSACCGSFVLTRPSHSYPDSYWTIFCPLKYSVTWVSSSSSLCMLFPKILLPSLLVSSVFLSPLSHSV